MSIETFFPLNLYSRNYDGQPESDFYGGKKTKIDGNYPISQNLGESQGIPAATSLPQGVPAATSLPQGVPATTSLPPEANLLHAAHGSVVPGAEAAMGVPQVVMEGSNLAQASMEGVAGAVPPVHVQPGVDAAGVSVEAAASTQVASVVASGDAVPAAGESQDASKETPEANKPGDDGE